ncbi:MAG TPA: hypothetical protein VLE91_02125 [Candidatus Saccharimonadales bacterium]|nr:hypothetical protein [Candidatus Saccharimonadales bacterium]
MANDRTQPGTGPIPDRSQFTPEMHQVARLLEHGDPGFSWEAYDKIYDHLSLFPKYSGPAVNKQNVRVATFGLADHKVDIQLPNFGTLIKLTYTDMDLQTLKTQMRHGDINVTNLQLCFVSGTRTPHRLRLDIWRDEDEALQMEAKIVEWSVAESKFVDTQVFPNDRWHEKEKGMLEALLASKTDTLPILVFGLRGKGSPMTPMEELHQQQLARDEQRRVQRDSFDRFNEALWGTEPRRFEPIRRQLEDEEDARAGTLDYWSRLRYSYGAQEAEEDLQIVRSVIRGLTTSEPVLETPIAQPAQEQKPANGPTGYKHKSPEAERQKYWDGKAQRSKKNQVKTKHQSKKK